MKKAFYKGLVVKCVIQAYFRHTIGELCASPVALSFITKLAFVKCGKIMMEVYFAATGLGNKLSSVVDLQKIKSNKLKV